MPRVETEQSLPESASLSSTLVTVEQKRATETRNMQMLEAVRDFQSLAISTQGKPTREQIISGWELLLKFREVRFPGSEHIRQAILAIRENNATGRQLEKYAPIVLDQAVGKIGGFGPFVEGLDATEFYQVQSFAENMIEPIEKLLKEQK